MGSVKSKRKSRKRSVQNRPRKLGGLQQQLKSASGAEVRFADSSEGIKMSEVLMKFIEPFMRFADTEENFRKLVAMAVLAWNASLLPKEEQERMIDGVLSTLPPDARDDGKSVVRDLMRRKSKYFAEFRRMIVGFEVIDTGDAFHLQVASLLQDT